MVARCKATTASGSPCSAQPVRPSGWCYWHDPALDGERAEARRKGGAGRSNAARAAKDLPADVRDLAGVQRTLYRALSRVEAGEMDPGRAQAMAALARAVAAIAAPAELAERIADLERAVGGRAS